MNAATMSWLPSVAGALLSLAWLAGLWYAAPLVDGTERDLADRLRNMIVIGVAIPFVLGFLGVFWGVSAFALLAVACGARRRLRDAAHMAPSPQLLAVLAASLFVVWPQLCRPILDGDSLLYHLPNAQAWAQSHSIWQTTTKEWLYPGASELFAAPYLTFGARWSLPLCGALPALLLIARITLWGRELGLKTFESGLCALALIATPIAAYESGTLQNDLWLAAFFVETLYVLRSRDALPAVGLTCLLKPIGFAYALIAIAVSRRFDARMLLAFVPLALWVVRDVVLLPRAAVPVEALPSYWPSTIAGNLPGTIAVLGTGLRSAGFAAPFLALLPIAGLALGEIRVVALAGSLAALLYAFTPLSYFGSVNTVAAGTSFRYGLPAMACGALVLCAFTARARWAGLAVSALVSVCGTAAVISLFWNDGWTRAALAIAPLSMAAVLLGQSRRRWVGAVITALVIVAAAPIAGTRAPGFFEDWMRGPSGASTHAFDWIAAHHPKRIVVSTVRAGSVLLMSPQTRTIEAPDARSCETAKRFRALLFVGTDRDLSAAQNARQKMIARACGKVMFEDDAALIVEPRDIDLARHASILPSSNPPGS